MYPTCTGSVARPEPLKPLFRLHRRRKAPSGPLAIRVKTSSGERPAASARSNSSWATRAPPRPCEPPCRWDSMPARRAPTALQRAAWQHRARGQRASHEVELDPGNSRFADTEVEGHPMSPGSGDLTAGDHDARPSGSGGPVGGGQRPSVGNPRNSATDQRRSIALVERHPPREHCSARQGSRWNSPCSFSARRRMLTKPRPPSVVSVVAPMPRPLSMIWSRQSPSTTLRRTSAWVASA